MKQHLNLPACRFTRPPTALLLLAALLLTGCKKDEVNKLPKATQEGKNTMGCLVDDEAWLPQGSSGGLVGGSAVEPTFAHWTRLRQGGGNFNLSFRRRKEGQPYSNVSFFVPVLAQGGTFALDRTARTSQNSSNPPYGLYILYDEAPSRYFLTGPEAVGTLTFTRFDTVACIASGTFEMRVREAATGQTHQLTRGRFDVRFTK